MYTQAPPTFHQWIKQRRQQLDLTQELLAEHVGCAPSTLRKIEAGTRQASRSLLRQFAEALEIAAEQHESFIRWGRGDQLAPSFLVDQVEPEADSTKLSSTLITRPAWSTIGREYEQENLKTLLDQRQQRLLNLTGPSGVGKTHLALAVAAELQHTFRDGALFIDATRIPHSELLLPLIASQLGIHNCGPSMQELVLRALSEQELLLIIDNMEHVIESSDFLASIVAVAPQVVVLTTSQEALNVRGEYRLRIKPLTVPTLISNFDLEALSTFPATALFCERVQAVNPMWLTDPTVAPTIIQICQRLDGLPLALELAAAYANIFTPQTLLAHLESALPDLDIGHRDAPWRQQTLQRALAWSYQHLTADEQVALLRLAILRDAWDVDWGRKLLDAAHLETPSLSLISALEKKSLLEQRLIDGEMLFTMLSVIREFALAYLAEQTWLYPLLVDYGHNVEQLAKAIDDQEHTDWWAKRLQREHTTVRMLIPQCLAAGKIELALQLVKTMAVYWYRKGFWAEVADFLKDICEHKEQLSLDDQVYVWRWLGHYYCYLYQIEQAETCLQHSIELAQSVQDNWALGAGYNALALVSHARGAWAKAHYYLDQSEQVWGHESVSLFWTNRGSFYESEGDYEQAEIYYLRSLEEDRAHHNLWCVSNNLSNLASVCLKRQQHQQAESYARQALIFLENLDHPLVLADVSLVLGQIYIEQQDVLGAQVWLQQALEIVCKLNSLRLIAEVLATWAWWFQTANPSVAPTILGYVQQLRHAFSISGTVAEQQLEQCLAQELLEVLGQQAFQHALTNGQTASLRSILSLIKSHTQGTFSRLQTRSIDSSASREILVM